MKMTFRWYGENSDSVTPDADPPDSRYDGNHGLSRL